MSQLPTGPSGWKAWLGFLVVFGLLVFCFPEMLGLALGILQYAVPVYIIYLLIGGRDRFVG